MAKMKKYKDLDGWLAANPLYLWRGEQSTDITPYTMRDAGDAIGASYTSVMFWERGEFMPKHKYMQAIATEMKVDVTILYKTWQAWLNARPAEIIGTQVQQYVPA